MGFLFFLYVYLLTIYLMAYQLNSQVPDCTGGNVVALDAARRHFILCVGKIHLQLHLSPFSSSTCPRVSISSSSLESKESGGSRSEDQQEQLRAGDSCGSELALSDSTSIVSSEEVIVPNVGSLWYESRNPASSNLAGLDSSKSSIDSVLKSQLCSPSSSRDEKDIFPLPCTQG